MRMAFIGGFGALKMKLAVGVGSWELTASHLEEAKQVLTKGALQERVLERFGIDFTKATMDDLKKPFYNALAVFLLLKVTSAKSILLIVLAETFCSS